MGENAGDGLVRVKLASRVERQTQDLGCHWKVVCGTCPVLGKLMGKERDRRHFDNERML